VGGVLSLSWPFRSRDLEPLDHFMSSNSLHLKTALFVFIKSYAIDNCPKMSTSSYQISRDGRLVGSFAHAQVRQMYESGVLSPTDNAWTEGMQEWKALSVIFPGVVPPPLPQNASQAARPSSPDAALAFVVPIGRSDWAILSGYLGLFSVLILPAPLAILSGFLALRDMRKNPHKLGKGRAWFGIVSGTVCLLVLFIVILFA
jgi:hypothetical protein